ncbi:MAG: Holliday junction resolvase RuvX, partial [Lachnospiraceae bacterium]|nr:Holliday junction resolvase RuvX [Lachnospiraceae bacterium]
IVLGLPKNMDGTEGERAALSLEFKDKLERRTGLPVHMWDERLTTVEAIEIMDADGIKPKDREKYVDMIAARVILEGFMQYGKQE